MQYDCSVSGIYSFYHNLSELSHAIYGCAELPVQIKKEICQETFRSFSLLRRLAQTYVGIQNFFDELNGNTESLANFLTAYVLFEMPPSYKVSINDLYYWQAGRLSSIGQEKQDLNVIQIDVISGDSLSVKWQSFDYDKSVGYICKYHFSILADGNISVECEPAGFIN